MSRLLLSAASSYDWLWVRLPQVNHSREPVQLCRSLTLIDGQALACGTQGRALLLGRATTKRQPQPPPACHRQVERNQPNLRPSRSWELTRSALVCCLDWKGCAAIYTAASGLMNNEDREGKGWGLGWRGFTTGAQLSSLGSLELVTARVWCEPSGVCKLSSGNQQL